MIQLVNIPNKSVNDTWELVKTDISNALNRSNGYALAFY